MHSDYQSGLWLLGKIALLLFVVQLHVKMFIFKAKIFFMYI